MSAPPVITAPEPRPAAPDPRAAAVPEPRPAAPDPRAAAVPEPRPAAPPATPVAPRDPDQAALEIALWESIKGGTNQRLFEAFLRRYPNGAFSNAAHARLAELKATARASLGQPDDKNVIRDLTLLRELRERLYELNFDPGSLDGSFGEPARRAVREFETESQLAVTGLPTLGLLRRLRGLDALKPWGTIVFARASARWGMAWGKDSRADGGDGRPLVVRDSVAVHSRRSASSAPTARPSPMSGLDGRSRPAPAFSKPRMRRLPTARRAARLAASSRRCAPTGPSAPASDHNGRA